MCSVEQNDIFDYLLVFVALEVIEIRLYEVIVQINTFKVGDGLIFGYVLRRWAGDLQIPMALITSLQV